MNVLLIMADELSTWGLGCHNPAQEHTPCLDALAARGSRFDAAYTPSPICVPTRAAIACGRHLHEIGYWSSAEAYDGRVPSWGHSLQKAGVPVTSIGKLHYRSAADDTGFDEQIELGDFFHQLHHRFFECNYGTVEMPWDRWLGSFNDGTDAATHSAPASASA